MPVMTALLIYIGTYTTDGQSKGVYAVPFDPVAGTLGAPVLAAPASNPTFLVRSPDSLFMYMLDESGRIGDQAGGAVTACLLNPDGSLVRLDTTASGGQGGTHLAIDATGRTLALTSYRGGTVTTFHVGKDGRADHPVTQLEPGGTPGPNTARQDKPHPHSLTFSQDGRFAYVCDLGTDLILRYRHVPATSSLTADGSTVAAPGAGPRHGMFSPDGRQFYVINELNSTVATYACNPDTGALTPLQAVSTLPAGHTGYNICAEIRLHPNGQFVYASNRGHDSIAVFSRDPKTGLLSLLQIEPSGGGHPRNFALSSDGRWLACANRDSNNLVLFSVDSSTGRLDPTGRTVSIPQPVFVLMP